MSVEPDARAPFSFGIESEDAADPAASSQSLPFLGDDDLQAARAQIVSAEVRRAPSGPILAARPTDTSHDDLAGLDLAELRTLLVQARAQVAALEAELDGERASVRRWAAVLAAAPVALLLLDVEGRVVQSNRAASELFGGTRPTLEGVAWVELLSPSARAEAGQLLRRASSGLAAVLEVQTQDDYDPRTLTVTVVPIVSPLLGLGHRAGALLIGQDITGYRDSERNLRDLLQQMQHAQRVAHIGSWRWDRSTDEVSVSNETRRLLGISPLRTRLSLEDVFLALLPDDPGTALALAADTRKHGNVEPGEITRRTARGERILVVRGDVVTDEAGRVQGHVGTLQDITDQRRAELERQDLQAQLLHVQKLESLGVLAGGIAHDFNNLLMGILGNASLARLEIDDFGAVSESIDEIERAGRRAADLCRQLLAYSGRGTFALEYVDLGTVITDIAALLRASAWKHAQLRLSLSPNLPRVYADVAQIQQIAMNLMINAAEALPPEGGIIRVRTFARWLDAGQLHGPFVRGELPADFYACIEIHDEGCGMTPEVLERLFDPFYSTKFSGRGLGLAAVLGIVRSHHGAIEVESEVSRGSTFRVWLPASITSPVVSDRGSVGARGVAWTPTGSVLLVDDEQVVRTVARRMLERIGFRVILAADGNEALARFEQHRDEIKAVILDLTMPNLDGERTLRAIRERSPELPILLSTGFDERETTARMLPDARTGILAKPYRFDDLHEMLRAHLTDGA